MLLDDQASRHVVFEVEAHLLGGARAVGQLQFIQTAQLYQTRQSRGRQLTATCQQKQPSTEH